MQQLLKTAGIILLIIGVLYPGSYLLGRVTGFGGMVVDDTVGIGFSKDGEMTAAMGGGILPLTEPGPRGQTLRVLNLLFEPARDIDHAFTEERFYWHVFED